MTRLQIYILAGLVTILFVFIFGTFIDSTEMERLILAMVVYFGYVNMWLPDAKE